MAYLGLYLARRDPVESEGLYRTALSGLEKKLGPDDGDTRLVRRDLAYMLKHKGDFVEAEPVLRRMLALDEKKWGIKDGKTNETVGELAEVLKGKKDYAAAAPFYRRYLEGQKKAIGPDTIECANTANDLSIVCEMLGQHDEAIALATEAVEHARKDRSNRKERIPEFEKRLAELEAAVK
ncbi:MAG: tetratricopeptide repeat protein [Chthoniobacteraceae bacterium]